ncbi:MAG: gliding motility lipoprotein GldD [Bacteroidota bacterium]
MDDSVSWHNLLSIFFNNFNPTLVFGLLAMVILLLLSGLVAAAEVSFFSLEPKDFDAIKKDNSSSALKILELLSRQKKLIATLVLAHNFVNIGVVVISETVVDSLFNNSFNTLQMFFIRLIGVTFLILLIGEVIPKIFVKQHALKGAYLLVFPLAITEKILSPLSFLLIKSTMFLDKFIKKQEANLSIDDLSQALELTSNEHTPEEEKKILKGIVEFGNTEAKQIMKPRMEMLTLKDSFLFDEVLKKVIEGGFSRIPVYDEDADAISGILYGKDLLPYLNESNDFNWKSLLRKPFFVPLNKKIDDLLKEFQSKRMHMAIVVDEYGSTNGLVTLEDIIEEILGDINDEFDEDELIYSKLDKDTFVFEAKIMLNDLYRVLEFEGEEFEEKRGDNDTLAGFILELNGNIPHKNQKITFENYEFTIESVDKRRIKRVKVKVNNSIVQQKMGSKENGFLGSLIVLMGLMFLSSCDSEFVPKPKGYLRIDLPKKKYHFTVEKLPYQFQIPQYAKVIPYNGPQKEDYWVNIIYTPFKATLHLSYFKINNDLAKHIEDSRNLAYKHTIKAESINEERFENPEKNVFGLVYWIGGNAASTAQFFLTDSTNNFIRGALYYNCSPNSDSLAPVNQYITKDIEVLMESFSWVK